MTAAAIHEPAVRRRATIFESLIPIAALGLFLGVGSALFAFRMEPMLLLAGAVAAVIARRPGYTWREMGRGISTTLGKALPALSIMICIGIMIASWIAAGTIPMLIYYGLHFISPRFFLLSAALICSFVSLFIGTSWGTVGTIGVALMGVAGGLGVSRAAAAGAIVSGAYFGDKLSPFSDQTNLAPAVTGVPLFDHIRWLLWTTLPAWLVGLGVYAFAGLNTRPTTAPGLDAIETALAASFHFSWLLLLPPLIILALIVTRRPSALGMLLTSVVASALAVTVQGRPVAGVLWAMVAGYHASTGMPQVDVLLSRGGMIAMLRVILLLIVAFSYAGIMIHCGLFSRILDAALKRARGTFWLIALTALTGILTALITGSSHLSIIVPGQLFSEAYGAAGLAAKNLSRTTEDSGSVV
ncbi:MAG: hypothetical protein JWP63_5802, partial [Candidatus Solibacter sp.]|nr:hypothetical protein [Candidatus Solibacter sp.]